MKVYFRLVRQSISLKKKTLILLILWLGLQSFTSQLHVLGLGSGCRPISEIFKNFKWPQRLDFMRGYSSRVVTTVKNNKYPLYFFSSTYLSFLLGEIAQPIREGNLWSSITADTFVTPLIIAVPASVFGYMWGRSHRRNHDLHRQQKKTLGLMKGVFDNAQSFIYIKDLEGRYILANKYYEGIFDSSQGKGQSSIVGKTDADLFPQQVANRIRTNDQRVIDDDNTIVFEEIVPLNGSDHTYVVVKFPFYDETGTIFAVGAIATDISKQKLLEGKLRLRADQVSQDSQAQTDDLADVVHEIRNPMTAIIGMADLLLLDEGKLNKQQKKWVNVIRSSSERLVGMLNNVLDISKIDANKLDLNNQPFRLSDVLDETTTLMSPLAENKGLRIYSLKEANVPTTLIGDKGRITQIIINLLNNAVKFTKKGEVAVKVSVEKDLGQGEETLAADEVMLHFRVTDNGVGIAPEKRDRIFHRFSQADESVAGQYGGAGLGLTISARLVDMMGGRIWIEDNPEGQGSVFHFTIRLRRNNGTDNRTGDPVGAAGGTGPLKPDLAGVRILLVDDDPDIHTLIIGLVQKKNASITTVSNGSDALTLLKKETFDLILTDLNMPVMDGIEFMNAFKHNVQQDRWADAPIIVLTGASEQVDVNRCMQAGACKHLSKPFSPKKLFGAIFEVLGDQ